jgi:hypothetical protein
MRPPTSAGPPVRQVQREFDGSRLAQDHQIRAYQKVLAVVRRSPTRTRVKGPRDVTQAGEKVPETLVCQEGVAA